MHGRAKVKTTISEQEKKKKERDAKVKQYRQLIAKIWEKRKKGEFDDDALTYISELLSRNPDISTLWNFRRQILTEFISSKSNEELSKTLRTELNLTESCILVNPKSYSAWHQRQWLMSNFPEPNLKKEMELCSLFLEKDDRNFHCWDYRRWVASKLNVPDEKELDYTMEMINKNFSNYSSWHYRSKLLPRVHPDAAGVRPISEHMHLNELELVTNAAFTDPDDQSAWFYQRWLLGRSDTLPKPIRAIISKDNAQLYIAFSSPVTLSQVHLKSHSLSSKWDQVTPCILAINSYENGSGVVELEVCKKRHSLKFALNFDDDCFTWSNGAGLEVSNVGPALSAVLNDQLNMCNQLLEYEPNSKWTLLTSSYIMLILDRHRFKEDIIKRLKLLQEYDPLRVNYYSYLISKYEIENRLEEERNDVCLSSSNIKSLVQTQYLLLTMSVNLSDNLLEDDSLLDLVSLQSCKKLKLDGNKLTTLKNLPSLPYLESLSVSQNNIQHFDDVLPYLCRLPRLKTLDLSMNPVASTDRPMSEMPKIDFILSS